MPVVAIRADASARTGTGHIQRCLSLARALQANGLQPVVVTRARDGTARLLLRQAPCPVHWLPERPTGEPVDGCAPDAQQALDAAELAACLAPLAPAWVVVDHYGLDAHWHTAVRQALGCRIAVIDDLANRDLACDLLVDQNWHADHPARYGAHLPAGTCLLGGPRYALLDDRYRQATVPVRPDSVRSIGVFLGGTDVLNLSADVVRSCRTAGFRGPIEVATTSANPGLATLRADLAADPAASLRVDAPDLVDFFLRHDLQVGAGGGATWERCCLGAPTVALVVAANQAPGVQALAALGSVAAAIAQDGETQLAALGRVLPPLLQDATRRAAMARASRALVDGWGAHRVAARLAGADLPLHWRAAQPADEDLLLAWSNEPAVRAASFDPRPITAEGHRRWFAARLADPDACRIFIACAPGGLPLGQVRLDRLAEGIWRLSYALDACVRGLGLGPALIAGGADQLAARQGPVQLQAQVRADNTASRRALERLGFRPIEDPGLPPQSLALGRAWARR